MELNEYQKAANKTANYSTCEYPFVFLGEESGEVLGKIAKYMRKHGVSHMEAIREASKPVYDHEVTLRDDLVKELGDCLWELAMCAEELGVSLNEVAERNIDKLSSRKERGVIDGSGDNR